MGKIKIFKQFCEHAYTDNQNVVIPTYLLEKGENMKGITKRTDGRYMIRKTIDGVKIVRYARTFADAKQILDELNKEQKKYKNEPKLYKPKKKTGPTLQEFAIKWLDTYKKPFVNAKSFSDIKSFTNRVLEKLGNKNIKELTTIEIQSYLNTLPKGRTKEKISMYFNSMLQKACDLNIIEKNPFNAVIRDKKVKCKNDAYTFDEQVKIIHAIKNTDIEHEIFIYLMCGCRPNELPCKTNFDFENNLINVYGTKNDNAEHRQIEMSQAFANYIKTYFENHDIQNEKYIVKKFTEICNNIGIKKPLLYRLRHTFATNHFILGTQAKIVQHWMGHSSISITVHTKNRRT